MKSLCSGVVRELSPARNTELTQHECRPWRRADLRGPVWWGHARHADEEPLRGTAASAPGARRGAPPPPVCRDGSSPRTAGCRTQGGTAAAHAHPRRPAAASPAGAVVRVTGPAVRHRMPHGGSINRASASQSPGARGLRPGPAPLLRPQSWLLPTSSRGPALWVRPASMSSFLLRRTQSCWVRAPSPQRPPFTLITSLKVQAPRTVHRRCWELGRESMNLGDGHESPSRRK